MVLCTKSGMKTGPGLNDGGASRAYIQRACERSLKRMGTDYIDLYLVHVFDPATPLEETLRALDDLVRAGKVRYVGCSNFFAWEAAKANGIAERLGLARFDVMESNWSIATREIERELVPMAVSESIGVLAWGALLGGMLTGKYKRGGAGEKLGRLGTGAVSPLLDENKVHDIVDVLREVAEAHGATPADIALAFVLHNKAATSVIFGATRPDQVDANLRASEITLTPEEMQKLDAVSALKPDYAVAMMAGARDARKRLL
jgi:aryl-alcohol dehydrogenase-like predicted oxidoreductase